MSLFFLDQQGPVAKIDCLSVNIGCSHADRSQDGKEASNTNILVPMPAVAEIILNQEVSVDKNAPPWMFGWINWRNLDIPLIDFAALQANQSCKDFAGSSRILVLNSLLEGHEHRYYAIVSQGFPHTIRIEQDSVLETQEEVALAPCISINIDCEGEFIQLPDFQQIENHLQEISAKQ
jgi:chemosensory pili system protein ChpC